MARIRARSSGVVRRSPASRQTSRASSQALRLKMKVMAGSIPSSWSRSITSTRRGVKNRRRGRPRDGMPRTWSASSSRRLASGFGRPSTSVGSRWSSWLLLSPTQVEVVELHRSTLLDHRLGGAAHGGDPVGQLLGVRHRGRQAHERDVLRQVDHHLLPHRTAVRVLQEVHLVEHHVAQAARAPASPRRSCCGAPRWSSPPPGRRR